MQGCSQTPGIQSSSVSSSCRPHGSQTDVIAAAVKMQLESPGQSRSQEAGKGSRRMPLTQRRLDGEERKGGRDVPKRK